MIVFFNAVSYILHMAVCTLKIKNSLQLYTRGRYKAICLRQKKKTQKSQTFNV